MTNDMVGDDELKKVLLKTWKEGSNYELCAWMEGRYILNCVSERGAFNL